MRAVRTLTLAVALLTVVVGIGQGAAAGDQSTTRRADRPDPFFGVISQRAMDSDDFDLMRWGRLGSYRAAVQWGAVERHGDGNMDWEELDRLVGETARRGITLLPTLYHTPGWLDQNWRRLPIFDSWATYKWKQFLRKAVDRYGSRGTYWVDHPDVPFAPIRRWQIWNEPNIVYFARPVSARAFAKLLRISAGVIRRRDPRARVVLGGLYGRPPPGKGTPAWLFLKRLYKVKGARRTFDVAAVHPYATTPRESFQRTLKLRRQMNRHRDRRKPLLITELGWGSDFGAGFGLGSQAAQSNQLRTAYRMFIGNRRRLVLNGIYWFSWSDLAPGVDACAFCRETGLFDYRGDSKPAWDRIIDFTHDL